MKTIIIVALLSVTAGFIVGMLFLPTYSIDLSLAALVDAVADGTVMLGDTNARTQQGSLLQSTPQVHLAGNALNLPEAENMGSELPSGSLVAILAVVAGAVGITFRADSGAISME